jgi:hypothetical protein
VNAALRYRVPAIAALLALAVVLLTPAGPGRVVAALYLSFAAPGLALAPVLGFRGELWWFLSGVVAISFAVDVIVAEAVLYAVGFHWHPCAVALVCITCLGSLFNPRPSRAVRRLALPASPEEAAISRD